MTQLSKKYKHKKTDLIFESSVDGSSITDLYPYRGYLNGVHITLPAFVVENSDDWEEITPVLFITEDGVEIRDKNQRVFYVFKNGFSIGDIPFKDSSVGRGRLTPEVIYFSSREARSNYILENKVLFSVNEVIEYVKSNWPSIGRFGDIKDFENLLLRAKSKLNAAT